MLLLIPVLTLSHSNSRRPACLPALTVFRPALHHLLSQALGFGSSWASCSRSARSLPPCGFCLEDSSCPVSRLADIAMPLHQSESMTCNRVVAFQGSQSCILGSPCSSKMLSSSSGESLAALLWLCLLFAVSIEIFNSLSLSASSPQGFGLQVWTHRRSVAVTHCATSAGSL